MSEQRRLSKLDHGGVELANRVLKNSPEGSLNHTIATNTLNELKAFLDVDLRATIVEVLFSEDDVDDALTEKLSTICANVANSYSLSPEQLSGVMDEIYEVEQTKIYG